MDYIIRQATTDDISFIVDTIIAAEKSGTEVLGLSTLFEIPEEEIRGLLANMLDEEIDGSEISISSFLIAEKNGTPIAAVGGWIECVNEDELPSSILKANLFQYYIPLANIQKMSANSEAIEDTLIERVPNTYQIEYVYTTPEFRGMGLVQELLNKHEERATGCDTMCVQVFRNNTSAIKAYEKFGFQIAETHTSSNLKAIEYLPDNVKLLMIKQLNNGKN